MSTEKYCKECGKITLFTQNICLSCFYRAIKSEKKEAKDEKTR